MSEAILVDSSFLAALYDITDRFHQQAAAFIRSRSRPRVIPEVILPEVAFLLRRSGGTRAVAAFLGDFVLSKPTLQALEVEDIARARAIMLRYPRADLDLVDCCITALAERLDITQIATFDRRDFSIMRPAHTFFLICCRNTMQSGGSPH